MKSTARFSLLVGAFLGVFAVPPTATPAAAQWVSLHEQAQLSASHNWVFRRDYAFADRLFNAFDYGHAILYETLLTRGDGAERLLEGATYDRLTREILVHPPRLPLEEMAVMPGYARLAPEAMMMFDWAHVLHRQAYDVLADERIAPEAKDARMAELLEFYLGRPDLAFSTEPVSMEVMDGQYYSLEFRERFPRFNGLIWGYHWLQVGLYEPLLVGETAAERQALARATVARFGEMLRDPPESMPYLMPMTAAVAPTFADRYPEMAIIFDNLHMMHDIVSDILASPEVPADRKRAEILRALAILRDGDGVTIARDEWRRMAVGMGVHNQGGPAVGFPPVPVPPTVPRGMSMAGASPDSVDHADHQAPSPSPGDP